MKFIALLSRHNSTYPAIRKPEFTEQNQAFTERLCNLILDQYPDLKTLKKLHSKLLIDQNLHPDLPLSIKLMRAYSSCEEPNIARRIFDGITERNAVFYNVMIRSYVNNHMYYDALHVYTNMRSDGFSPDHYTYPCVLKSCSRLENLRDGLQIHATVVKVALCLNLFVRNGLVAMYGSCGCLMEARKVLDEGPHRDVVSWNAMVGGYAKNGHLDEALEVCREMESSKIEPDAGTMASLFPAVTNTSAENVSYLKEIFTKLAKKDLVSWNVMIAVYVSNSMSAEAIDLYTQMEAHGVDPDAVTLASVLPACGDLSALSIGRKIHDYVKRRKFRENFRLENALVDMYAKCGCLKYAREVFDEMKFRDVVSWTSMISAYGMSGRGPEAVALFSSMLELDFCPDSIAFVSVLSACSHGGLLDEGKYYYNLMIEDYKIVPRTEHFSCMVDLFGRAGRIGEAYDFIKEMPTEPNERVWGALLSACRVYNDMNIGVLAADHLFQLAPKQSGYYVLLSNIYAKAGRWESVTTIRSIMKRKGIKKMPGVSNVELNGRVHTFLAGDQSHPQSKEMYKELDVLMSKMKEMGYMPETNSALHDVEEEDKEFHLAVHSEKLALVFALLNTQPGTPVRITKNLRVCGDCHIAVKLISVIAKRHIIIRDNNRFHHFEHGVCSCGDYW